jgi:regulator of PEP synthase PpsR (kinase-PPPase family)
MARDNPAVPASASEAGFAGKETSGVNSPRGDSGRAQSALEEENASGRGDAVVRNYFHLHLVSDATGETLIAVSRAAAAQYETVSAIEHVYPLVRSEAQLARVLAEIEASPGVVLYTLVEPEWQEKLESFCRDLGCPCLSVLQPVLSLFQSYLGQASAPKPGAQHVLNTEYFRRIDAMNYTLLHDDGQMGGDLDNADVILVGISRTSKTPTSIYLANRGIKTANIPLVPNIPLPPELENARKPLIVGLIASADRIVQIRQNRLLSLRADDDTAYVDPDAVADEVTQSRRLCARKGWPVIDVTRRSIEETAASILDLLRDHRMKFIAT